MFKKSALSKSLYIRNCLNTFTNIDIKILRTASSDAREISENISILNNETFNKEFIMNQIKLTTPQQVILSVGSAIAAIADPRRQDMIACLGETTGKTALHNIFKQMQCSNEGVQILTERPRINSKTIDLDKLRNLPSNSFGSAYVKFLNFNNVTPDSRLSVRFMENSNLAYIMTRYRECHDLIHTILGMPTNMLGEVTVKWVEAMNMGIPMCYGAAVFGAVRLKPKQRRNYLSTYLPWAITNGKRIKPLLNIYWEKRWEQDIDSLRRELGIKMLI